MVTNVYLQVSEIHSLHITTYGSPNGLPILFLHGGPGLGCSITDRRFFDPKRHFVIFMDQRGSGKSIPSGELKDNMLANLIEDINLVLHEFGLDKITLFGGSWGSTLALLFAIAYPMKVEQMILRSVFLADLETLRLFDTKPTSSTKVEAWERYLSKVPPSHHASPSSYYYEKILSDGKDASHYALEYLLYSGSMITSYVNVKELKNKILSIDYLVKAKIQAHFASQSFFIPDNYILDNASQIAKIPMIIIHGKQNQMCPISKAEDLLSKLNHATLIRVKGQHAATEPEIEKALLDCLAEI